MTGEEIKVATEEEQKKQSVPLRIYCNGVTVQWGVFDFVCQISTMSPYSETDVVAEIFFSPQHAKAFANILSKTVRDYEEKHGILPEQVK